MKKYYETTKCIECGAKATHYGGHVMKGKTAVIAGWCDQHGWKLSVSLERFVCRLLDLRHQPGRFGRWLPYMGIREWVDD